MRAKLIQFFHSHYYTYPILAVIFINCATLGLNTFESLEKFYEFFEIIDDVCFAIFCVESLAKLYAFRIDFFTGKWKFWNIFDVLLILTTTITPHNILILRGLRAFRVLRLITVIPSMRFICTALTYAVPQILSIAILLLMFYYIYGVLCYELFSSSFPQYFGTLGRSLFSLFCIMTLDGGSAIIKDVMTMQHYAWMVFLSFILISTFVIMNLIIALIVNNMDEMRKRSSEPISEDDEY